MPNGAWLSASERSLKRVGLSVTALAATAAATAATAAASGPHGTGPLNGPVETFFLTRGNRPVSIALRKVSASTPVSSATRASGSPSMSNPLAWASVSASSRVPSRRFFGLKKPAAPRSRYSLVERLIVVSDTPKAFCICPCVALPCTINWLVNSRKLAKSSSPCMNTGKWPL